MKIKKAVIPVAGKGTRFLPATKEIPKEMIPILDKPMIHYAVEEAVRSGIEEVLFITSSGKEAIENYFDRNFSLESFLESKEKESLKESLKNISEMIEVCSVRQKKQLGLGHAISYAESFVGRDNFAVILADDLVISNKPVTKQLIDVSTKYNNVPVLGVMEIKKDETHKYGVIDGEPFNGEPLTYRINKMVEKPSPEDAPSLLATPGRYILNRDIFDALREIKLGVGGEYQLTDAINILSQNSSFLAHIFEGKRYDTGTVEGHLRAIVGFALSDKRYNETMKTIISEVEKETYK